MTIKTINYLLLFFGIYACAQPKQPTSDIINQSSEIEEVESIATPIPGAERVASYIHQLEGKTVGVVSNQTSNVGSTHLVDTLIALGIDVAKVFAPEHGFRGNADAGEKVKDGKDPKTGLPIISLYGSDMKPNTEHLKELDMVLFDIQDVGVRFYTYISTMSYMMEACAEQGIQMMILDRPNPNGHYVDGPVLDPDFSSFVGMHPVPVVHGMTMGEYAVMVNGEGWLKESVKCDLIVIELENYTHDSSYILPLRPSPNLPDQRSIYLYPSLCFFEGTIVSEGRGTDTPFQIFGYPNMPNADFKFKPRSIKGAASNPKFKDEACMGKDLSQIPLDSLKAKERIDLSYLLETYKNYNGDRQFFDPAFFDLLAGSDELRTQILAGKTETQIRDSWNKDLDEYRQLCKKYLLYP